MAKQTDPDGLRHDTAIGVAKARRRKNGQKLEAGKRLVLLRLRVDDVEIHKVATKATRKRAVTEWSDQVLAAAVRIERLFENARQDAIARRERVKAERRGEVAHGYGGRPPDILRVYIPGRGPHVIDVRNDPVGAMYGRGKASALQWEASRRFARDYEMAVFEGLSSADMQPSGGGGGDKGYLAVVARLRLERLRVEVGHDFVLLMIVCGEGRRPGELSSEGFGDRRVIERRLLEVLNAASAFYDVESNAPLRFFRAAHELVEEAKRVTA